MLMLHKNGLLSNTELRQRAADMIYSSNAIPPGSTIRSIFADGASSSRSQQQIHPLVIFRPITINTSPLAHPVENENAIRLAIVPWKPTADAMGI